MALGLASPYSTVQLWNAHPVQLRGSSIVEVRRSKALRAQAGSNAIGELAPLHPDPGRYP
jgi:hypothetical protein